MVAGCQPTRPDVPLMRKHSFRALVSSADQAISLARRRILFDLTSDFPNPPARADGPIVNDCVTTTCSVRQCHGELSAALVVAVFKRHLEGELP